MLTKEAFNAFLKTLEEPPEHVIFIFATTELHKMPETIISRTQRYDFMRLGNEEIIDRLKFITAHAIDRVDAEFGHLERFRCFDIKELRTAFTCNDPGQAKKLQKCLQTRLRDIAVELGVDGTTAAREYREVATTLLELTSPGRPLATASNGTLTIVQTTHNNGGTG